MLNKSLPPWAVQSGLLVAVAFAVAAIAATALRTPMSLDAFWHLAMGRDLVQHGLSPWVDHYSFTYPDAPISAPAYVFQVVLYGLVSAFGVDGGFFAYKWLCGVLLLAAARVWLRDVDAPPASVWLVLVLLAVLFQLRATTRPELLSYALTVVAMIQLRRAGPALDGRQLAWFGALLLFWCNYHTPLFGYILMFAFFVDAAAQRWREGTADRVFWQRWFAWSVGLTAIGFVNPGFNHSIITMLTFSGEWKTLIDEYAVPTRYAGIFAMYVLMAVAVLALVCMIRLRRAGFVLVWLLLSYNALLTARLVTPAGIIVVCTVPWLLRELGWLDALARAPARIRAGAVGATLVALVVSVHSAVAVAGMYLHGREHAWAQYPVAIVDYLRKTGQSGRIFNDHNTGGYLLYELAPDSQVHIDGRTGILYPLEHMRRWISATHNATVLKDELERHDVPLVLLKNTLENHFTTQRTGVLTVDFADQRFTLWRRGPGNFPLTGMLEVHPACWREDMAGQVMAEYARAAEIGLPVSRFRVLMGFLAAYAGSDAKAQHLASLEPAPAWSDSMSRFAAYRALDAADYELALRFFAGIRRNEVRDLLASAWTRLQLDDGEQAAAIVALATRTAWTQLEPVDLLLTRGLIEAVEAAGFTDAVAPEFKPSLTQQLTALGLVNLPFELGLREFCTRVES